MAAAEMDLLDPEPANNTNSPSETRPRKRRRRTVACTQCRTRKLKCDREYPACSRCLKSGIPDRCKYEDSFVWQQPNTVTASTGTATGTTTTPPNGVAGIDRLSNSHITLPPPSRVAAGASPRFATVLPAYPKSAAAPRHHYHCQHLSRSHHPGSTVSLARILGSLEHLELDSWILCWMRLIRLPTVHGGRMEMRLSPAMPVAINMPWLRRHRDLSYLIRS